MRHILLVCGGAMAILVASAGCGPTPQAAAQVPAPPTKFAGAEPAVPTPKEWVGVWSPLSCVADGVEMMSDPKSRDTLRLSIENGEYKLYALTDPVELIGKKVSGASLTVDEKAGTFTLTITTGHGEGKKVHGVYEVTAEKLKLCYGPSDQARPTKFESAKGSGVFNEEWARVKLKK